MQISSSSMPRTTKMVAQRAQPPTGPEAEPEKPQWKVNLWMLLAVLLVAALVTAVLRALPQGVGWLFAIPPMPETVGELATVLAPLLAVAVSIERLLETVFSWYEQSVKSVADVMGKAKDSMDWIEREVVEAYEAAAKAAAAAGVDAKPEQLKALEVAEKRLAKAEQRLLNWVKAPEYVTWKKSLSIWVGLLVGLEVTILGDLGMLHTIGVPAPRLLDMLITGLAIGAGPGPMHSLIGMLQGGKDALEKLAKLADGKAIRAVSESFKEDLPT
jgi:nucleotide-binding universal stress UspA family protein